MEEAYLKSLQMIKYIGIIITKRQYNQLAKKHNLLSYQSMQYISKCSFERLIRKTIKEGNRY